VQAIDAADKYNLWLRKNAAGKLPRKTAPGIPAPADRGRVGVAARGGLEVGAAEFRDTHYPMPEGINAYEWFAGAQSSNGKVQLIRPAKAQSAGPA